MQIDQNKPAIFYFMCVDSRIKFGITSEKERRWRQYMKDLGEFTPEPFKTEDYEYRWQAELVEQVLKWRLWDFITVGEHESVEHLSIPLILDVYQETRDILNQEYESHEHIHSLGPDKGAHYKQLAQMQFKDIYGN